MIVADRLRVYLAAKEPCRIKPHYETVILYSNVRMLVSVCTPLVPALYENVITLIISVPTPNQCYCSNNTSDAPPSRMSADSLVGYWNAIEYLQN